MVTLVGEWVRYLQQSGGLLGIPLLLAGVVLMLSGWRLWKLAVTFTFGVIGALIGVRIAEGGQASLLYAVVGFVLFSAGSYPPVNYSVVVLGGVIGASLINYFVAGLGLAPVVLWIITGIGLVASCAIAFLKLRHVVVLVTSFEGAVLLFSAAVAFLSEVPELFHFFRPMAYNGSFFVPFVLLVPTVVGTMIQLAEVNRRDVGISWA